ncbi:MULTISPECIES: hypothetical protein [Chryseobacterium]|jgi:hypothetical protein|uniref:Uncharacterized protein n=1 Tax=Chryseobacterium aquaticum subsp. greenlandense TaxID=345663 RepID=A0A124F2N1_9FLAO|nr:MULTISPECIES: hypothetical protein [Chryseobacterium]KUJ55349.1 hypothetical protein AR686_13310 [Chryseobacterium aquaticum subsp. greenlandense]MDV2445863.1 hypothetical protein [Elizabethkingia anophelis]|tara:strand:- start:421 stop:933 length:513 start_codon:yes stop_codon:yes gene_type:complete
MNRKQKIISVIGFCLTLLIHFFWVSKDLSPKIQWADVKAISINSISGYEMYFQDGEYYFGLSYALAIAFTLFAFSRIKIDRKKGATGFFGGITFSALLATFGCLMIGCCGSPMAIVYINMFGSSYLNVAKPLMFVITLISVVYAYRKMTKNKTCESCEDSSCTTEIDPSP